MEDTTRRALNWLPVLSLLIWAGPVAAGVTLQASSATVAQPGDRGDVCIALRSGGAQVAGTQNDLVWDGSCATLSDAHDCRANPDTNKELHGTLHPQGRDFTYRALVLSLSDVNPIPDGVLYCCAFRVEASPGECCSIGVVNAGAADPKGSAIAASGVGSHVCVAASGSGGSPTPTATPVAHGSTAQDDGCHIGPAPARAPGALLALGAALWLAARRRRI
jgi:hypothetical protein